MACPKAMGFKGMTKDRSIGIVEGESPSEVDHAASAGLETFFPAESSFLTTSRKTLLQRVSYPPRLSLNGLLIALLCLLLVVLIGFVPVNLPSPLNLGKTIHSPEDLRLMQYSFQLPVSLLCAALMGPFMGVGLVLLFVVLGLTCFPLFANGGGWQYLSQPGFGYWLGAILGASILGRNFHKVFQKHGAFSRSFKLLSQALWVVLLVHGTGLLYLAGLVLVGQIPWGEWPGWALRLSLEPLPYDALATFVFLCLVRQFRLALWLVLY